MTIKLTDGLCYDFDGTLTDKRNNKVVINCRIWPPIVSGDIARIELSIPTSKMPLPDITNPCHIEGKIGIAWT